MIWRHMRNSSITAIAHPNIALIKYWGDRVPEMHIPSNGSISMNLEELWARTSVTFDQDLQQDDFVLNGVATEGQALDRVRNFFDMVRKLANHSTFASVVSANNFPIAAGLASSAAGFAALSLAASRAAGLDLDEQSLSRLARRGSGSACRSIPGGFVEWQSGQNDADSFAYTIAPANHWDLVDCIALVEQEEKAVSSILGHLSAASSPLQHDRLVDAPRRLSLCREAILERNFIKLAKVVELDSNMMHSVMITSSPPIIYWLPATVAIIRTVQSWRKEGLEACYTIDAGPNVHVLCPNRLKEEVSQRLLQLQGVANVITAHPGGPAALVETTGRE
jgi:diphosphomevalonate decarboxylase